MKLTSEQKEIMLSLIDDRQRAIDNSGGIIQLEIIDEFAIQEYSKQLEIIRQQIVADMTNKEYVLSMFPDAKIDYHYPIRNTTKYRITAIFDEQVYELALSDTEGKAWREARNKIKKGF